MDEYERTPEVFRVAFWDGVDPGPVDEMISGLFGDDYLGSEQGTAVNESQGGEGWLRVKGRPDSLLWFRGAAQWVIPAGNMLVYGPVYPDDAKGGNWSYYSPEQFARLYTKVVTS